MKMLIRVMKKQDYEKVYALWRGTVGVGTRSLDDSEQGIGKFLDRNPRTCFVAEQEGSIAGVILSGHDGRRAYIYHTAVAEKYRRRGIGAALIQAVEKAMTEEGINKIALVAFKGNKTGNDFWEGRGYAERNDLSYRNRTINPNNR
jgi:ribosomal protein S18 acetylase RimI-like enzyme